MFQSLKLRVMVCLNNQQKSAKIKKMLAFAHANKSLQYTESCPEVMTVLSLAFVLHKPLAAVVVWRPMAAIAPI